jgi:hypothetical protein
LGGEREGAEWVLREGVGAGGEMNQALYAHMNNKRKMKKKKKPSSPCKEPRKQIERCEQVRSGGVAG